MPDTLYLTDAENVAFIRAQADAARQNDCGPLADRLAEIARRMEVLASPEPELMECSALCDAAYGRMISAEAPHEARLGDWLTAQQVERCVRAVHRFGYGTTRGKP